MTPVNIPAENSYGGWALLNEAIWSMSYPYRDNNRPTTYMYVLKGQIKLMIYTRMEPDLPFKSAR